MADLSIGAVDEEGGFLSHSAHPSAQRPISNLIPVSRSYDGGTLTATTSRPASYHANNSVNPHAVNRYPPDSVGTLNKPQMNLSERVDLNSGSRMHTLPAYDEYVQHRPQNVSVTSKKTSLYECIRL